LNGNTKHNIKGTRSRPRFFCVEQADKVCAIEEHIIPLLYICAMTPKTKKQTRNELNETRKKNKIGVNAIKKIKNQKMEKGKLSVLHIHALREVTTQNRLLILERQMFHQNATEGKLIMGNKTWDTVELPWKENQKNISCIPSGTYTWQKIIRSSNKQPALYIRDVDNRTEILIHEGNKPTQSEGCILLHNYKNFHRLVNNKGLIVII